MDNCRVGLNGFHRLSSALVRAQSIPRKVNQEVYLLNIITRTVFHHRVETELRAGTCNDL
jgi:hypothetical protein